MMDSLPKHILDKIGRNLHLQENHPVNLVYRRILKLFTGFDLFDELSPIVSIRNNFDLLRIPVDHPSRSKSDTYYVDSNNVLRTHTSAHQVDLLKAGHKSFLVCGDVYRKDTIDSTHYPVFHQLEGVKLCDNPEDDLKDTLSKIIKELFDSEFRFKDDFFPFTHPSWEVEVNFENRWLEVLGCGVIHPEVLENAGITGKTGWAFGLGLDRLAMILYGIPDIRYLWSKDERFLNQFRAGLNNKFQPFSNQPICYKDIAFWLSELFNENEMFDLIRNIGGNLVESVELIDTFNDTKNNRISKCYRINFRDYERTLTNEEVNLYNSKIRDSVRDVFKVSIR